MTTDWMNAQTKEKLRAFGIAPPVGKVLSKKSLLANETVACPQCRSENTKIKSMFGSALDPTKTQEYSAEKCTKLFKAMVFGLRSKANPSAPSGWTISQEDNLDWFGQLLTQKTSVFDSFLDD